MIYLFLLFLEIIFLFFLSRSISKNLSRFLPIPILSLIFFPGVVIHELSHLLSAAVLFVRVGDVEFSPKIIDGGLKLGSVAIGKTDTVRRAIIGFAPVFVGLLVIIGLVSLHPLSSFWGGASATTPESVSWRFWIFDQNDGIGISLLMSTITLYLLFVISNTMFSSKADMEGTLELVITLSIIFIALYLIGFRFPEFIVGFLFSKEVLGLVQKSSVFLLAPIIIDLTILGTIKIFRK